MTDFDRPMKRKVKRVFNRATGKHETNTSTRVHPKGATGWYKEKLGIGNKQGEGALAKRRKKAVDSQIKKGSD